MCEHADWSVGLRHSLTAQVFFDAPRGGERFGFSSPADSPSKTLGVTLDASEEEADSLVDVSLRP